MSPMKIRRSVVVGLLGLVLGCEAREPGAQTVTVRDSAGIEIIENAGLESVPACQLGNAPQVSIGTAEGEEAYQLYRVFGATRLSDGRITLVDDGSKELRFYDSKGIHLMSVGGGGEGPGEFRNPFYLWTQPGDTVWVGDYSPFRFQVFGPDDEWLRTVRPTPEYLNSPAVMFLLDDGRSVLGERVFDPTAAPGFRLREQPVVIHGRDGALIDSVGTYPNGRWGRIGDDPRGMTLYTLFESFARITASGHTLAIGHGSRAELRLFDVSEKPRLVRIIRWEASDRDVEPDDVAAEYSTLRQRYADMDASLRAMMVDPLVSDERPVADQFPAFDGLRLGRDGRVWIREHPMPDAPEGESWVSFDTEGHFDCAVIVNVEQVYEFGADYVLVLHEDDLGLERVQLYDLGEPAQR